MVWITYGVCEKCQPRWTPAELSISILRQQTRLAANDKGRRRKNYRDVDKQNKPRWIRWRQKQIMNLQQQNIYLNTQAMGGIYLASSALAIHRLIHIHLVILSRSLSDPSIRQ